MTVAPILSSLSIRIIAWLLTGFFQKLRSRARFTAFFLNATIGHYPAFRIRPVISSTCGGKSGKSPKTEMPTSPDRPEGTCQRATKQITPPDGMLPPEGGPDSALAETTPTSRACPIKSVPVFVPTLHIEALLAIVNLRQAILRKLLKISDDGQS